VAAEERATLGGGWGRVDLDKVADLLPGEQDTTSAITVPVAAWVDRDGLVRRVTVEFGRDAMAEALGPEADLSSFRSTSPSRWTCSTTATSRSTSSCRSMRSM
jgi:hypothetical protein